MSSFFLIQSNRSVVVLKAAEAANCFSMDFFHHPVKREGVCTNTMIYHGVK